MQIQSSHDKRSEKLDLRISPAAKQELQEGAAAANLSVAEFVISSARARAADLLPDRRVFRLNEEQWSAFQAALDAPPRFLPEMHRLLTEPGYFDTDQET